MDAVRPSCGARSTRRAALYLRVSTRRQTTENQRPDVVRAAKMRGLRVVATYEEKVSAVAKERPAFERMMGDAHAGTFDVLVIWSIDRFGRSMIGNMRDVLALDRAGVEVVSVREAWLDTGGPVRDLLVAIFSWVAEQERTRLGERTRAGLERAERAGVKLGRPRRAVNRYELGTLRAEGLSHEAIARRLGVSASTVGRALRRVKKGRPREGA